MKLHKNKFHSFPFTQPSTYDQIINFRQITSLNADRLLLLQQQNENWTGSSVPLIISISSLLKHHKESNDMSNGKITCETTAKITSLFPASN